MMIKITANAPPRIFDYHRANRSGYEELAGEEGIRQALLVEQVGLCAYCERRLSYTPGTPHSTRIEHFHPQNPAVVSSANSPACEMASGASPLTDSDTTWTNLLLCCDGEEGRGAEFAHCDVSKGNTDICSTFRNPKTYPGPRLLEVLADGTVVPRPELPQGAAYVVDNVLRLNQKSLKTVRSRIYGALFRAIAAEKRRPPFGMKQSRRQALRATLEARSDTAHPSVALAVADKL